MSPQQPSEATLTPQTTKTIVDIESLHPLPTVKKPVPIARQVKKPRYPTSLVADPSRPVPRRQPSTLQQPFQGDITLGIERYPSGVDFPGFTGLERT
jgi:hypothetical protein